MNFRHLENSAWIGLFSGISSMAMISAETVQQWSIAIAAAVSAVASLVNALAILYYRLRPKRASVHNTDKNTERGRSE